MIIGHITRVCCDLERDTGIKPMYCYGLCKGLYQVSGKTIAGKIVTNSKKGVLCDVCRDCEKLKKTNLKKAIFCSIALFFMLSFMWVMATPQGAIRRNLLATKGPHAAVTAVIREGADGGLQAWDEDTYYVTVDGLEEQWKVWSYRYSCYGKPDR